jgi:hypothetical protein
MRMEIDPVSKTLCSLVFRIRMMDRSKNLVISSVIHHHQNPLESTSTGFGDEPDNFNGGETSDLSSVLRIAPFSTDIDMDSDKG